ncbi:hypothetical protein ACWZHB_23830 [Nocardia sp. FBN12]|uniref:hypothetical protein n=1 Tax=Nocardia sp. FBN12 TaxID=3419766 RepID=UPI003CFD7C1D
MDSGEDFGSWGAAFIWALLAWTIGAPLWLWTGEDAWLIILVLPGIGLTGVGRGVVWVALATLSSRGTLVAGWFFVSVAVADAVAISVWKLSPSGWTWPVAAMGALVLGAVTYLAVASEVAGGWLFEHGAALQRVEAEIAWTTAHPDETSGVDRSSMYGSRSTLGLRLPPFAFGAYQLNNKLGGYHARMARRYWISAETDMALLHAAESSAAYREMVSGPLGYAKMVDLAQSLYEEAFYLDQLQRRREAVDVRTEEIDVRRQLVRRFDKRFPKLVAKATRPRAKTETKQKVVAVQLFGQGLTASLVTTLTTQATGLTALERTAEAAELRAEAEALAAADL